MTQAEVARIAGITLKHPLMYFMREVCLPGNYRFRVIVAGATVELFLTMLIRHHSKKLGGDVKKLVKSSFATKIRILHKAGILSDNRATLLNHFRNLRNDAAHEAKFKITKATIAKFPVTLVKPENLPEHIIVSHICTEMAFELWNEHHAVLASYFFTKQERNELKDKIKAQK